MLDLAMIFNIENKMNHKFEKQARVCMETLRYTNPDLLANSDIYFVQPTANDIAQDTVDYFTANGWHYIRKPGLAAKTKNRERDFNNKVDSCNYTSKITDREYLAFIDTDIVWLRRDQEFFRPTDRTLVHAFPTLTHPDPNFYLVDRVFDMRYQVNHFYQKYFRPHIDPRYDIDHVTHYIQSWFLMSHSKSEFWDEWKWLTDHLLDIAQQHHADLIDLHLECYCEEVSLAIMYAKNPERYVTAYEYFGDVCVTIRNFPNPKEDMLLSENTTLYHYATPTWDAIVDDIDFGDHAKTIRHVLVEAHKKKNCTNSQLVEIYKNYVAIA